MEAQPERWNHGVAKVDQHRLEPQLKALEVLCDRGLTAAVVVVAFHR